YTILLMPSAHLTITLLHRNVPFDTIKDFDAVATIARSRYVLVLHPSLPANTLQEFIALAKSRPGQLNYASSGVGTGPHLAGELFDITAGTKMQYIPYKGAGPALTDLIGGRVQLSFQVPISALSHIKSGKLKAIAITGEARMPVLPQVPTFAEAGLPGYKIGGWYAIAAPAGTPKAIINKLSSEIAKILAMPDTLEYLARQGTEPFISTPEELTALMKADMAKYARIIKTADIKL
ncbi:MAG: tripartite tricarboxylate transporter substrate-binding protein, partial [Pseudomonadota bacterium]